MNNVSPSSVLVEPGAPPWAQRLGLRLAKTFVGVFPTAPMRLWTVDTPADLPPATDWPGGIVYTADGAVWVSDGTSWHKVGPATAPTDAVTPPQFDNDTSIATTAWVTRFGKQYSNYFALAASAALSTAHVGSLIQYNAGSMTLTLPKSSTCPPGATITIWAGGGSGTLAAFSGDTIFGAFSSAASMPVVPGDTAALVNYPGVNGWVVAEGSLTGHPQQPQFDSSGKWATTAFVKRAMGGWYSAQGISASTALTAAHIGLFIPMPTAGITITLPKGNTINSAGAALRLHNTSSGLITVQCASGDNLYLNNGYPASMTMAPGSELTAVFDGGNGWELFGSAVLKYESQFNNGAGFQVIAGSALIQAGYVTVTVANAWQTFNYPTPFSSVASIVATPWNSASAFTTVTPLSGTQFQVWITAGAPASVFWMAFGKP